MSVCQGTKDSSWLFIVVMVHVTDLCAISRMIRGEHGIQYAGMPCSPRITVNMLPEIHTMEKSYVL